MKKFVKLFTVTLLIVSIFASLAVSSSALPINDDMTDSYNYSYFGTQLSAPEAYRTAAVLNYADLGLGSDFAPVDLLVKGDYLYVVDAGNNQIVILDKQYQVVATVSDLRNSEEYEIPDVIRTVINEAGEEVADSAMLAANRYQFNSPQGIFVDDAGLIYVADTGNRRIVVCNTDGEVFNVVQGVEVSVLGDTYIFQPTKIIVDAAGGINVLATGVNRGIMVFDDDGTFRQFTGAPNVSVNAVEWFWRLLATEEQKANMTRYVPTEYSNITVDARGFTYATIGTLDYTAYQAAAGTTDSTSDSGSPVKRLSGSGVDMLRRTGRFAIVGDISYVGNSSPRVVDVCVTDSDIYTLLDQNSGRLFTYGPDGDLLYIGGGYGSQYGRFQSANSIATRDDDVIVSDASTNTLTVFELTDYAKTINNAIVAHNSGNYDEAENLWNEVLSYNSGLYMAYIGMGKAEMRKASDSTLSADESLAHYETALEYFRNANETTNYSKAFKELQNRAMTENFGFIAAGFVIIVAGCIFLYYFHKARKKKKLKAERGGNS